MTRRQCGHYYRRPKPAADYHGIELPRSPLERIAYDRRDDEHPRAVVSDSLSSSGYNSFLSEDIMEWRQDQLPVGPWKI